MLKIVCSGLALTHGPAGQSKSIPVNHRPSDNDPGAPGDDYRDISNGSRLVT